MGQEMRISGHGLGMGVHDCQAKCRNSWFIHALISAH